MRRIATLLVLTVNACASSGTQTESEIARPPERIVASDRQGMIRTTDAPNAKSTIEAPPARVLAVIKSVYDELGIPSAEVDAASGKIATPTFNTTRKLGAANLSTYFNCGDSLNGNIANTYRMYVSVASIARSDGKGGTQLETAVSGAAADMAGASSGRIPCGTTGQLEERIQRGVSQKVGAAP